MIDWGEVEKAEARGGLDEWDNTAMADAVSLWGMFAAVVESGTRLEPYLVEESSLFPFGGPRWPWQNPEALKILADEPGFDLQILLDNLPTTI